MAYLEKVTAKWHDAYFVDLFVRPSNNVAVGFYRQLGYEVYRSVTGYYNGETNEDAFDMRKSMPKDVGGNLSKPLNKSIMPHELEYH